MKRFRWGIFGTGAISAKFAAGLSAAESAQVTVVASRTLASAQGFARGVGASNAIEGYAKAAKAGGVDAVYIATPPSEHANHAILCIEAGIPVLIEKPLATSGAEARRIADASREKSVFAMEAMWTRFLPAAQALREAVLADSLGEVRMVAGSFGTSQTPSPKSGNFDPARGGGAMAHLGVYPLSLGQWLFGEPLVTQAIGSVGRTGVDEDVAFQLQYPSGVIGSFFASIRSWAPNDFRVMGTEGSVAFRGSIVRPHGLRTSRRSPLSASPPDFGLKARLRQYGLVHRLAQLLGRNDRQAGRSRNFHYSGNGYHYQADEVRSRVQHGDLGSDVMPLADSIAVADTADAIRRAVHSSSPREKEGG